MNGFWHEKGEYDFVFSAACSFVLHTRVKGLNCPCPNLPITGGVFLNMFFDYYHWLKLIVVLFIAIWNFPIISSIIGWGGRNIVEAPKVVSVFSTTLGKKKGTSLRNTQPKHHLKINFNNFLFIPINLTASRMLPLFQHTLD